MYYKETKMYRKYIFSNKQGTIHKRRRLKGRGRGVAKMAIWGDFQGLTEATGGGRGVTNHQN